MWEDDKQLISAYKACYTNLLTEMREGGEVDLEGACQQETIALQKATEKAVTQYKKLNTPNIGEKYVNTWTPIVPYFQNL